jgi:hypothetical protein
MRKPRFSVHHTERGYVVLDELKSLRVRGPYDGATGKRIAAEKRDELERFAASERERKDGAR